MKGVAGAIPFSFSVFTIFTMVILIPLCPIFRPKLFCDEKKGFAFYANIHNVLSTNNPGTATRFY
jgi:hypothetical protein